MGGHVKTWHGLRHKAYDCWAKRARMSKAASEQVAVAVVRRLLRHICLGAAPRARQREGAAD